MGETAENAVCLFIHALLSPLMILSSGIVWVGSVTRKTRKTSCRRNCGSLRMKLWLFENEIAFLSPVSFV